MKPAVVVFVVFAAAVALCARGQQDACENGPLELSASVTTHVLCHGAATGALQVNVTVGDDQEGFDFFLDDAAETSGTTGVFSGLVAGTYTVTVVRVSDNCTETSQALEITQPTAITLGATPEITAPSSCDASDGVATVTAEGGLAPYTLTLGTATADIATGETATFAGLAAGIHNITIVDANSCRAWGIVTVTCDDGGGFPTWAIPVIVIGGILVLGAIAVGLVCGLYKRHQKRYRDVFRDADEEDGVGVAQGDPTDF